MIYNKRTAKKDQTVDSQPLLYSILEGKFICETSYQSSQEVSKIYINYTFIQVTECGRYFTQF